MKKLILLMLIVLMPGVLGLSGTGEDTVESVFRFSTYSASLAMLDCSAASGTVVAVDVSKAQNPADAQLFMDDLVSAGYYVSTIDVSTAAGQSALSCVDILLVWSLDNNYAITGTYSTSEVDAIESFVNNGGGLFFLSDHTGFGASTANLISRFSINVNSNMVEDDDDYLTHDHWPIYEADNFISGPIFSGVSQYIQYAASSFVIGGGSPLISVVTTDTDGTANPSGASVVAAGFYQKGCMVVTGDTNWVQDFVGAYSSVDNSVFALNLIKFLEECKPEDVCDDCEVPEFGIVGALVALAGASLVVYRKRK